MSKISKKSKKIIVAAAFILGSTALSAGIINAQTSKKDVRMGALVDVIAEKFDLDSSEVESVINEVMEQQRKTMLEDREQEFADRLDQAVIDGKITQTQADLIASKKDEVKSIMEDLKDMDEEQRHETIKTHMDSLKTWATENNIPKPYILFGGKGPEHKGAFGSDFGSRLHKTQD